MKTYKCRECDFSGNRYEISQHYRWKHPKKHKKLKVANHKSSTLLLNGVNFCPNCGCNIKAVGVAINLHQL
jgi:predicted RNA-binding Zn-ribbon protein involved in translation (DUF1610 family)